MGTLKSSGEGQVPLDVRPWTSDLTLPQFSDSLSKVENSGSWGCRKDGINWYGSRNHLAQYQVHKIYEYIHT